MAKSSPFYSKGLGKLELQEGDRRWGGVDCKGFLCIIYLASVYEGKCERLQLDLVIIN